jgi:hypothetical protein
MRRLNELFAALHSSDFRKSFRLKGSDLQYLRDKGAPVIESHARDLILKRLAPATPANDGKQTPFRGHPVFVAQHGTATCCRGCLEKWHYVKKGVELSAREQDYVVGVIQHWLAPYFDNSAEKAQNE